MQGVQPSEKIAPSPNAPSGRATEPDAGGSAERGRGSAPARTAGRTHRQRGGRGPPEEHGIQGSPGALQVVEAQDAGQVQPEDDEDEAAKAAEAGQPVGRQRETQDRAADVDRQAQQDEDRPEAQHEGDGLGERPPPRRRGRGDDAELAQVRRHDRQDARRHEADQPGDEGRRQRQLHGKEVRRGLTPAVRPACAPGRPAWPRALRASGSSSSSTARTGIVSM